MAKIILVKKPSKLNIKVFNSFCLINLLSILSKAIETVMAERISYLVEKHGLLPLNHYRALKQKYTIDALLIVQEKIYRAWRDKKVPFLVIFDLKEAFNGMTTDILLNCL